MPTITYSLLDSQMTQNDTIFFKKLGKRMAELRKELGITQAQADLKTGVILCQRSLTAYWIVR
ncbi:MAG TPA: hypothetical protein ENI75_03665 [Mizugakiibacter sp.]|nr:hypothetical protein [Mizugakiibacter sp.]